MKFFYTLIASIIVSLLSLIGAISLLFTTSVVENIIFILISFAAGTLIGASFLHILPEIVEKSEVTFYYVVLGFIVFFILEKYLYWRHCHKGENCELHPVSYLNILGDTIHNFIDGMFIGASFFIDVKIGIVSTIAVILHEIPQELGDFGILLYSGLSVKKAILYNFLSGLASVIGAILGYVMSDRIHTLSLYLLPLVAGGFIYVSCCDLIPELHRERNLTRSLISLVIFLLGIGFMSIL
ncbi:MAG: ZIP family metal transporter [Endomicrobia bacterium]|nr:ZIP family metal transporter [Endomicrobiia bacterium]MDW8055811.1 ZIP family metal transporter [Elusimicrobiota bacterium]